MTHIFSIFRYIGEIALPTELSDAVRLNDWLIQHCRRDHTHFVAKRHAQRYGPIREAIRLDAAITELEALDRIQIRIDGKKISILVNPRLLTQEGA